MITYDYAMIAVGHNWRFDLPYSQLAVNFARDKHNDKAKVHLTTNDEIELDSNLIVHKISKKYPTESPKDRFNFNIKFLSIKNAFQNSMSEYIVYVDSDLQFHQDYNEANFQTLLAKCKESGYDICSSAQSYGYRPAYDHKYGFINIDPNDQIATFEENFLILKNNYKLKFFLEKWEELYWVMTENDVYPWAEALEIGISARYADMKCPEDDVTPRILFKEHMHRSFWTMDTPGEVGYRFYEG